MSYSDTEESDVELEEEDKALQEIVHACKHGILAKVKEICEREGKEYIHRRDEDGHTFVHWAALAGQNEIISYFLEQGASPNEHSKNDYGPCPIHWACVHGHVITVDLLLEQGVPIDMTDFNRCSPLTIAAQYGQSLCVSYLLQKGANKFHVDINGDSALHWAAFKGHPECVFLLLNAGLSPRLKDSFGQTPLHSASIKGDLQCVEMLLEHGAEVDDSDKNNKTPKMLAAGRRHRQLVKFLTTRDAASIWDWRTLVFGPPGRSRAAVLFFVFGILFWSYPVYFIRVVPISLEQHWNLHLAFWVCSVFLWVMFVWSKFSDPGYVKSNQEAFDEAVKMIGSPAMWGDYRDMNNPIYNMCHTCKAVRPVRAKHCRQCNRCVEEFDHHCPWIDNCIGRNNRVPFSIFLYVLGVNGLFAIYFSMQIYQTMGIDWVMYISLTVFTIFFISGLVQFVFQSVMIVSNLTTNERANYQRYHHFKTSDGKYRNPFNRGLWMNCLEYWKIIAPAHLGRRRQTHIV